MSTPQGSVLSEVIRFARSKVAAVTCPICNHLIATCEKTLEGEHMCPQPEYKAAHDALLQAAHLEDPGEEFEDDE